MLPHFSYCSTVWNNCLKADCEKFEKLNERALRYIYNDFSSDYIDLANRTGGTLANRLILDTFCVVFKAMKNRLPSFIKDTFKLRDNVKNLRGTNKLVLPCVNTSRYGLKSTVYTATKQWNTLPDNIRVITSEKEFKISLNEYFQNI